jgi:hypothetical protein
MHVDPGIIATYQVHRLVASEEEGRNDACGLKHCRASNLQMPHEVLSEANLAMMFLNAQPNVSNLALVTKKMTRPLQGIKTKVAQEQRAHDYGRSGKHVAGCCLCWIHAGYHPRSQLGVRGSSLVAVIGGEDARCKFQIPNSSRPT